MLSNLHYDAPPTLILQPKQFFVEHVCYGSINCKVAGWYPETGGDNIYVLDTLDLNNEVADSIVLHEIVHYLQFHSGMFQDTSCENSLKLERQAYGVQKEYLLREGVVSNGVGLTVISMHCE
jgi:hypothetical protein